jgi:2',3'-cyclic-nucleotide 2'-phosphodiesterase (5'-nucleotidase family)
MIALGPLLVFACATRAPQPPAAASVPSSGAELAVSGPVESRVSTAQAELVLFYAGEHRGSLETCGCPTRPRGSITRMDSYLQASRAANPGQGDLLLHGGYWLEDPSGFEGLTRPDVPVMNRWMVSALEAVGLSAANVGVHDLPGLISLDAVPDWAVSANIVTAPGKAGPKRWVIVERDGLRVGVTGITSQGFTLTVSPDHQVLYPHEPAVEALRELAPQVDVLVLLAYQATDVAREIALAVPELDVVIDTNMHQAFYAPERVGEALWLRSHNQTMRLGELRLMAEDGGGVELVVDRKIDLDPEIPDSPRLAALVTQARDEIEAAQKLAFGGEAAPE